MILYKDEKQLKISVVISVYNIERYIRQCLDSVLSSSYGNLEIVLVDDGSTDGCPQICDEYSKMDSRIKVIHQRNQGAVTARRNGVLLSTGHYISMLDGDDWISPTMYEEMINCLSDGSVDILFCGYIEELDESFSAKSNSIESGIFEGDSLKFFKERSLKDGKFYRPGVFPALWCKMFRRNLLIEAQEDVPSIIKMGDDAAVTYPAIALSSKVVVCNEINGYHYRIRQDSLSRSFDLMYFERATVLTDYLALFFKRHKESGLLSDLPYYRLFLFKIGVESLISDYKNKGFYYLPKKIKNSVSVMDINSCWKDVDIENFNHDDYRQLEDLSKGRVYSYLIRVIIDKIKERKAHKTRRV